MVTALANKRQQHEYGQARDREGAQIDAEMGVKPVA